MNSKLVILEKNKKAGAYIEDLIALTQNNEFLNTYLNIVEQKSYFVKKDTIEEQINDLYKNIGKKYENLLIELNVTSGIRYNYLFSLKVFKYFLTNALPSLGRTKGKFSVMPNNSLYIIILSFLSEFNSDECNDLLAASKLQKLHGRNIEDSIFIYCLNNKIPYEHCLTKYIDAFELKYQPVLIKKNITFDDVHKLQKELNQVNNSDVAYTDNMTDSVCKISKLSDLEKYLENNFENFSNVRMTPIRYICDWWLNSLDNESLSEDDKSKLSLKKESKKLWIDFLNFYENYSKVNLDKFYTDKYDEIVQQYGADNNNVSEQNNYFYKVLVGEKQLKRKFFILLYIFFHGSTKWNISMLDITLDSCGFDSLDTDTPTIEAVFLKELSEHTEDFYEFIEEYNSNLYTVKIYCDLYSFMQKRTRENKYDLTRKKVYILICEKLIEFHNNLTLEDLSDEDLAAQFLNIVKKIDFLFRGTNKKYIQPKKEAIILKSILTILEEKNIKDYLSHIKRINKVMNFSLDYKQLKSLRINNDLTEYIENPLYLNPKTDY